MNEDFMNDPEAFGEEEKVVISLNYGQIVP